MGNCLPSKHRGIAPIPEGKSTKNVKRITTQSTKASQSSFGRFKTQGEQIISPKPQISKNDNSEIRGYQEPQIESSNSELFSLQRNSSKIYSGMRNQELRVRSQKQLHNLEIDQGEEPNLKLESFIEDSRRSPHSGASILQENQRHQAKSQKQPDLHNQSNLILKPTPSDEPNSLKVPTVTQKNEELASQNEMSVSKKPSILHCWEIESEQSPQLIMVTARSTKQEIRASPQCKSPVSTFKAHILRQQIEKLNLHLQELSISQVSSTDETQVQNSSYYGYLKEAVTISTNDLIKLLEQGASDVELSFKIVE